MGTRHERNEMSEKEFHYGLALLRIWMCFEVVCFHFFGADIVLNPITKMIKIWGSIAVPVFMILSFAMTDIAELAHSREKTKKRFCRLLVPHFFWTVVYYLIYLLLDKTKGLKLEHGFTDALWQLFFCHSINETLWFQFDLIIMTVLFLAVFRLNKRTALAVSLFLAYLAVALQYFGINGSLFRDVSWPKTICGTYFSKSYVIYPIGRFTEMVPYAVIGIFMGNYKIFNKLKDRKIETCIGSALAVLLVHKGNLFNTLDYTGWGCQGLYRVAMGFFTVMFFVGIPSAIIPNVAKKMIASVSKYTMAIYFMHRLIATILYKTSLASMLHMSEGSIYDCLVIFAVSLAVAFGAGRIPIKWVKMSMS